MAELWALRALGPLLHSCIAVYTTWKLTQSFGRDFFKIERMLNAQYALLMQIASRRQAQLAKPIDPDDDNDPATAEIIGLVQNVKFTFDQCEEMIAEYKRTPNKLQKRRPIIEGSNTVPEITRTPENVIQDTSASVTSDSLSPSLSGSQQLTSTHSLSTLATTPATSVTSYMTIKPDVTEVTSSKKRGRITERFKPRNWIRSKSKTNVDDNKTASATEQHEATKPATQSSVAESANEAIMNLLTSARASQGQAVDEISSLQTRTGFELTVKWAAHDLKKFQGYIDELTKYVATLDRLTEERLGSGMLPSSRASQSEDDLLRSTVLKTQGALKRLHKALRAANGLNYRISLLLSRDFEADAMLFVERHDYLGAMDASKFFYFTLQVHSPKLRPPLAEAGSVSSDVSSTLVVETPVEAFKPEKPRIADRLATNLDRAPAFPDESSSADMEYFERWGEISSLSSSSGSQTVDVQSTFRAKAHSWTGLDTLESYFSKGTPAERMTVNQRIQLALLITYSVLYLADIRVSCQPITVDKFRYYVLTDGENIPWDDSDPLLLRPYLDVGLGQRQQGFVHGGKEPPRSLNPVADLGLSLLLAGCCTVHKYDGTNPRSLAEARNWGLSTLQLLDSCLPVGYTELVRDCIGFELRAVPGQSRENQRKETEFLLDKVRRLCELDNEFNAATIAGSAVLKPKLTGFATSN